MPLCSVSWGSGVCSVLVRSVSPCTLVLEVRLFPSPPLRCFVRWPVVGVCFFLPLAFQGWPGLGRACVCVCVCSIWTDVKLLFYSCVSFIVGWWPGSRGGRWPTKTPPWDPCKRTRRTSVVHLGAFKSQLVATVVLFFFGIYLSIYLSI